MTTERLVFAFTALNVALIAVGPAMALRGEGGRTFKAARDALLRWTGFNGGSVICYWFLEERINPSFETAGWYRYFHFYAGWAAFFIGLIIVVYGFTRTKTRR